MRGPVRESEDGGLEGGEQVATVRTSMSLRTKNLGNVPPRLDTLVDVSCLVEITEIKTFNLRSQEGHISTPIHRIRNLSMECRHSDKHDCVHKG